MCISCLVGSTNNVKVQAAKNAIRGYHSGTVNAEGFKADPGIREWRSEHAVGQPFGVEQTAFGAIHRVLGCLDRFSQNSLDDRRFAVAFENGLVPGFEVGDHKAEEWFDICFVAFHRVGQNFSIIKRGKFIKTPFSPRLDANQIQFDEAVKEYEAVIMPKICDGVDLYRIWSDGRVSRQSYLEDCLSQAMHESEILEVARDVIGACVASGMAASAGSRYRNMLWTRDLAYMMPAYLEMGFRTEVLKALRVIKNTQCSLHEVRNNGYEDHNYFGKIPIVTIAKEKECEWLRQRIRGEEDDPFFQIQLWDFCKEYPELIQNFPKPPRCEGDSIELMSLDHCGKEELVSYYRELKTFWSTEVNEYVKLHGIEKIPGGPSFALKAFMEGKLENLTPGTRDSEIQFIRALFVFVDFLPENEMRLVLDEFGIVVGRALFHLFTSVIDPEDNLPLGADTRDNFADILYDAKLLSNAVFWYGGLVSLLKYSDDLESTSLRQTVKDAILEHQKLTGKDVPSFLKQIEGDHQKLSEIFKDEMCRLKISINNKLLFKGGEFAPRDFVQGEHAKIDVQELGNTKNPIPNVDLVQRENPGFLSGEEVDPQSLAQAVLAGIVPTEFYNDVIASFKEADSPIGVQVFVPISAKTEVESGVLAKAKGRVVWPHISWAIIQALILMKETGASFNINPLDFAERQRNKLVNLTASACGEWYAYDFGEERVIQGGDPKQGWSASLMYMAIKSFYDHYRNGDRNNSYSS